MTSIPHYEQHAARLVEQYESLSFEEVHASLLDLLPPAGATVLDIGAGSGRDAAWLAANGYDVVAVEPSQAMLAHARERHPSNRIHWLADSLPDLANVRRLGLNFDLILLSAVWMHIPPAERQRALRKLATLLAPKGRIAISLRLGPPDSDRAMHEVSLPELASLAQQFGLRIVRTTDSQDKLGRPEVSWTNVVLGLPDDGLGALPLLRHLILVDEKASTYKIGLLRVLARIADTAAGLARYEAESVVVPLGLVSLFWMRMYKPLIENALPQMPVSRLGTGPGFVTHHFTSLRAVTAVELRIGSMFRDQTAKHLHRSLSEISQVIRDMPANYLRWPASDQPIFEVSRRRQIPTPALLQIDEAFLWSFGDFRIPLEIWQALTHYNVWIEPVLVSEWVRLIESYAAGTQPDVRTVAHALLAWVDPARDTSFARAAVERIRASGKPVYCVWSGARLRDEYDVDHCFSVRGLALRRRLEPDAGITAGQHPEIESAGDAGGAGAGQRYHRRVVARCVSQPGGWDAAAVLFGGGADLADSGEQSGGGGCDRCDEGASDQAGQGSGVAGLGALQHHTPRQGRKSGRFGALTCSSDATSAARP